MKSLKGKAIVFLADGMADEPIAELGGRTPLEAVDTPFLDSIAKNGASGTLLTLPEGFPTSSDAANMSVLGYDLASFYPGRGPIEATSQEIPLAADDVAWRCNLVTVQDGILKDYSAGHIPRERAEALMKALAERFNSGKVTFHSGVSYRNLLILHGPEFSAEVDYFKPDSSQDLPVSELRLRALKPEAQHTVDFVEHLMAEAAEFLSAHPLNQGLESPANWIWPWSPGRKPSFPGFSGKYDGRTAAVITAVDVIAGIAKCAGMDVIPVKGATGYLDTNYAGKAEAAIRAIEDHDFVYVHLEAIDECSHEGNLAHKMQAISDLENRIVKPVMTALAGRDATFAILPDHPVPLRLRAHTRTPVPVAICGPHIPPDSVQSYSEKEAPKGALGLMHGEEFVRKVLNLEKSGC